MKRQHGVWSLILTLLPVTLGAISIAQYSKFMALMYVILSLISLMIIVYSFCSKCPCRQHGCGHVLPGKLTKLLTERAEGSYTKGDYFGVLVPSLLIRNTSDLVNRQTTVDGYFLGVTYRCWNRDNF